jgi:hypothetical protein
MLGVMFLGEIENGFGAGGHGYNPSLNVVRGRAATAEKDRPRHRRGYGTAPNG